MQHSKKNNILILLLFCFILKTQQTTYSSNSFKESPDDILNPDQGFYRPVLITMTPNTFVHGTNTPEQVYHLRCDISQFSGAVNSDGKDKKLTSTTLDGLDSFLSYIKKDNKNAVIRFSYDPKYAGNENKEASLTTIETHIQQLSEVLNKYQDTITAIEAGLLGPWGEMHTSKIATEENKAKVFGYWLKYTTNIPILARTPRAMFKYFGKSLDEMEKYTITSSNAGYRLGLFNDGYLGSNSDMGTYDDRKRETKWLATQNDHLPFGGETSAVTDKSNLEVCLPEMFLLRLSYLNIEYHQGVIEKWKKLKYNDTLGSDSLFYGVSGFDYIKRHLGYRLLIKSLSVTYESYGNYEMKIKLRNVGFGNMLKTKKIDVIFTDLNDKEISRANVGKYNGEMSIEVKGKLLAKGSSDYKVYMSIYGSIESKVVYYPIKLANKSIYNSSLKAHHLFNVKQGELVEP